MPAIGDIVWCIGSNTKVFAATSLAVATVSQSTSGSRVTLDTAVSDLLPQGVNINLFGGDAIWLQHLATHTAGWPDGMCAVNKTIIGDYTFPQMQEFLTDFQPSYAPGTEYFYSNQAFALLGTLVSYAYYGTTTPPADWDTSYMQ